MLGDCRRIQIRELACKQDIHEATGFPVIVHHGELVEGRKDLVLLTGVLVRARGLLKVVSALELDMGLLQG